MRPGSPLAAFPGAVSRETEEKRMEFILVINLAFSIVGFFFIFRMWREVKARRDYYGENFGLPKGEDRTQQQTLYSAPVVTPEQQAAMMAAYMQQQAQPQPVEQSSAIASISDGDLQKIVEMAVKAQNGGV